MLTVPNRTSALLAIISLIIISQSLAVPPEAVTLTPIPVDATAEQIQTLIDRDHNVYFPPGQFNIGTLKINGWKTGVIFGAGRMTTKLNGRIQIAGSTGLTLGNLTIQDATIQSGQVVIDVTGDSPSDVSLISLFGSAGTFGYTDGKLGMKNGGIAIRMAAPGVLHVQGVHTNGCDIGLSVENPQARVSVFGGNYQAERIHLQQLAGRLQVRAVGTQLAFGGADIVITAPSLTGPHLIEGIRSEGSNGQRKDDVVLRVPSTTEKVDVVMRGNGLGGLTQYADYNACGTLTLVANAGYPPEPPTAPVSPIKSRSPGPARILMFGNKLGDAYATAGPFDVARNVTVISTGDLWKCHPDSDPYDAEKHFTEPVSADSLTRAKKPVPSNVIFTPERGLAADAAPEMPRVETMNIPVIKNLSRLMTSVRDFGAIPDDGNDDTEALQKAIEAALLPSGYSKPLYFPAGRYQISKPLFFDHLAGGGFWGDGQDKSIIVSTTGKGVLRSDGAGYSTFVDLGFENVPGADTNTVYMGLWNNLSKDQKRHPNTGASTQANMFYRTRFQGGAIGLATSSPGGDTNDDGSHADGAGNMGDGFMIVDCIFRNIHHKGRGAGYFSMNYNTLTNPLVNCLFDDVDYAAINHCGSFNAYGNTLTRITSAGFRFENVVSDGFVLADNTLDASPVGLIETGHSSSAAHIVLERAHLPATSATPPPRATQYAIGGAIVVTGGDFGGRVLSNGGGIGDNALIVDKRLLDSAEIGGRAHLYLFRDSTAAEKK